MADRTARLHALGRRILPILVLIVPLVLAACGKGSGTGGGY